MKTAQERYPTLRQSRLATFDRCALSAKFEEDYRQGDNSWTGHPQARGQIFHRFAAKALRTMSEMGERTIPTDLALAILAECLRQHDVDVECPTCQAPIVGRAKGRILCSNGHDHHSGFVNLPADQVKDLRWVVVKWANDNAFDIDNLVSIEERLAAPIMCQTAAGDIYERVLTGQLDAMFVTGEADDEAIVLDWKDTWAVPGPTDVGFDGYFQQRFYAWLVFKTYPTIQKVTLREFYVRFSEPREATVWRDDIEDIENEMSALAERFDRAFNEENFPPSPGAHCQVCPRPGACPIFSGVRGEGAITSQKMAEKVAAEAIVIQSALKQRKTALAAWASAHGDIPISDHKGKRVWGHRETKRTSRPTREQVEMAIAAHGPNVDLDELFKKSKTTRFVPHMPPEIPDEAIDADLLNALEQSVAQHKESK